MVLSSRAICAVLCVLGNQYHSASALPTGYNQTASFGKTITTFNTGMFNTVSNYDERRLLLTEAQKEVIDSDLFCQQEIWYKKDLDLMLVDEEWMSRYPFHYHFNNEEIASAAKNESVPALCPATTMGVLFGLIAVEACQDKFEAATIVDGKSYTQLKDDLFALLECWEQEQPAEFASIHDDRKCYGCLINAGTSGDIMQMTNCMQGSSPISPNDQAYESFLYGLVLWSKEPLDNPVGREMTWDVVPRGFISAEYTMDGLPMGIVCTHTAVEGPEQQSQYLEITQYVAEKHRDDGIENWILAGDMNSGPASANGSIVLTPSPNSTNNLSSPDLLSLLGWWSVYAHCDFEATWDPPTRAENFENGNTNICAHSTGKECAAEGDDGLLATIDHILVRGPAMNMTAENYICKRTMDERYFNSNGSESYHISDHYGVEIEMLA